MLRKPLRKDDRLAVFTFECVPVSVYVCPFVSEYVITLEKFPGRRARNIMTLLGLTIAT